MGRNKGPNKQPLQALAYPSYLLKKDAEVTKSFLVVRTLICFQQASSLFLELSNNAQQTITSSGNRLSRATLSACTFRQPYEPLLSPYEQFRIHCQPRIPPILACLHHHSFVSFQIECDFNTGSGGHLLSDPGGGNWLI